jgi:uncharacterized protein YkwD
VANFRISTSQASLQEGRWLRTTIQTSGVQAGRRLYWSITGNGINETDFSRGKLQGSGKLASNGSLLISHLLKRDELKEGAETLEIRIYTDKARTRRVGPMANVRIKDAATTSPSITLTENFTINSSLGSNGEVDRYSINTRPGSIINASVSSGAEELYPLLTLKSPENLILKRSPSYNRNTADLHTYDLITGKAVIEVHAQGGRTGNYKLEFNSATPEQIKDDVIRYTNAERAKQGLAPLMHNNLLERAAQLHVEDMDRNDQYLAHEGSDGSTPRERIKKAGYRAAWAELPGGSLHYIRSENAAAGQTSAAEVVSAWMNSDGHRAAIMDPHAKEIGIGVKYDSEAGRLYWIQNFGIPWQPGMTEFPL